MYQLFMTKVDKNELDSFRNIKTDPMFECLWQYYQNGKNYPMLQALLNFCIKHNDIDLALLKLAKAGLPPDEFPEFEETILTTLHATYEKEKKAKQHLWYYRNPEAAILADIYHYKDDYHKLMDIVKDEETLLSKYKSSLISHYPDVYLDSYKKIIKRYIALRGRDNYQIAAKYATVVKSIYCSILNKNSEWDRYIKQLREENRRLPALQQEFSQL